MAARLSMTSKVSDSCFLLTVGAQVILRGRILYSWAIDRFLPQNFGLWLLHCCCCCYRYCIDRFLLMFIILIWFKELSLGGMNLTSVPSEVCSSNEITKVDLSRNSIEELPVALSACSSLEVSSIYNLTLCYMLNKGWNNTIQYLYILPLPSVKPLAHFILIALSRRRKCFGGVPNLLFRVN